MEHPDNPLLDAALAAIRERANNTNPIQVEHIAIAVEAVRADSDALAAKVADAGERIAQAIEAQRRSDASWDDNRELTRGHLRGLDKAAAIARAALSEGEKP